MSAASAGDADAAAGALAPPEPLDATRPPDRYCDLVLTGGLTDGVIYPWAALELARHFRFKNIGGASVGAMAAALVAAAEYARRHGHNSGFDDVLRRVPEKLAEPVGGKTRLLTLFQPAAKTASARSTRRLFELFVELFSPAPGAGKADSVWRTMRITLCAYRCPALLGLGAALFFGFACTALWACLSGASASLSWLAFGILALGVSALLALLLVTAAVLISLYLDLVRGVEPNDYGLCRGGHVDGVPADQPSLTEWLHHGIQGAARKKLDEPLTFKDLWDAPGGPVERPMPPAQPRRHPRSIDLRMVTANLTHGRPYGLPLEDETSRLFFKLEELEPFFPPQVIRHLQRHAKPYRKLSPEDPDTAPEGLLELPKEQLPVVVAARLSLSFPFLFSTVPLWAIDYEPRRSQRVLRKCRFSDGGICSNFPIHMFDATIPEWPTFGIFLSRRSPYRKSRLVWLPKLHDQGHGDAWDRFDERATPRERLLGFASAIAWTAKDWNDRTTTRLPGVRDRVVRVFFAEREGGLNLKLSSRDILRLARKYGRPSGKALVEKFVLGVADGSTQARGWNEHRWVRFNAFLVALRERIQSFRDAAERFPHTVPMSRAIEDALDKAPLEEAEPKILKDPQAQDLKNLLAALQDLEVAFSKAVMAQPYAPQPEPELRVRAPL